VNLLVAVIFSDLRVIVDLDIGNIESIMNTVLNYKKMYGVFDRFTYQERDYRVEK